MTKKREKIGVVGVDSCYGDGEYPVFAERNEDGHICRVVIDMEFIDEEE